MLLRLDASERVNLVNRYAPPCSPFNSGREDASSCAPMPEVWAGVLARAEDRRPHVCSECSEAMPATNVVGNHCPSGSGAQRCAQCCEARALNLNSTAGATATTRAWSSTVVVGYDGQRGSVKGLPPMRATPCGAARRHARFVLRPIGRLSPILHRRQMARGTVPVAPTRIKAAPYIAHCP